jgi:CRP-like cAMP-binding protein
MTNPFIRKLEYGADLTCEDRELLARVSAKKSRVPAGHDIINEGDNPIDTHLVMGGFACRYKQLANGSRQIMALLVPGDLCDLHARILGEMDHSVGTLSEAWIVPVPPRAVEEIAANPRINRAMWWMTLVDEATLREWLVNLGQRDSWRRLAHLLCEVHLRLRSVGVIEGNNFDFPIRQSDLANFLGISTVHLHRSLTKLREQGLITLRGKHLTILDLDRLRAVAEFNQNYLHLRDRRTSQVNSLPESVPDGIWRSSGGMITDSSCS